MGRHDEFAGDPVGHVGAVEMLCAGAALGLAGELGGEFGRVELSTGVLGSVVAVGYLIVFGSLVAYTAYFWLLANAPLQLVTTYAYVNPVVAVALGVAVLGEPVTASAIAGLLLILAGSWLSTGGRWPPGLSRARRRGTAAAAAPS